MRFFFARSAHSATSRPFHLSSRRLLISNLGFYKGFVLTSYNKGFICGFYRGSVSALERFPDRFNLREVYVTFRAYGFRVLVFRVSGSGVRV